MFGHPHRLSFWPWLPDWWKKQTPSAPVPGPREDPALGKNFCLEFPESYLHSLPLAFCCPLGQGAGTAAACQEITAPGHAWPIAYLVTNDGRSHFSFPLDKCQTIRKHWIVGEKLIMGTMWFWGRFTVFEQSQASWLSSRRRPYEHSTWLCNDSSTGRGAPADAVAPNSCLLNWKFMVAFLGLIRHKESYFFCSIWFFCHKMLKLHKWCKPIFSDTDSESQPSSSLLCLYIGRSLGYSEQNKVTIKAILQEEGKRGFE